MILVTVGASQFPFDRLLRAVDAQRADDDVVVQHGCSDVRPAGASCVEYFQMEELADLVNRARAVVMHGGIGSILLALTNGKTPIVVPRRKEFGETVDDHQVESARRLARAGLVRVVEDTDELASALDEVAGPAVPLDGRSPLLDELRTYIGAVVGPPREVLTT